ncbi:uncharacterized protein [Oscarella lobularis]|uniref:uncharacterized protein n=1 Tax=Oscarella lobularis TaxID=121494 RepID=UPI003313EC77
MTSEVRPLRSDELENWFDFLARAFAEKGTPRTYFVSHVKNDPWMDVGGVLGAFCDEGTLASTLRIFVRRTYINGSAHLTGGIGEVSTHPSYRNRGLSAALLSEALEWMNARSYSLSMLHSSRLPIRQIYARRGWKTVPVQYTTARISKILLKSQRSSFLLDFHNGEHVKMIMELYLKKAPILNGAIVRDSEDYWRLWIQHEMNRRSAIAIGLAAAEKSSILISYIIAGLQSSGGVEVYEYISERNDKGTYLSLLHDVVMRLNDGGVSLEVTSPDCMVPRAWVESFSDECCSSKDEGCMYRIIGRPENSAVENFVNQRFTPTTGEIPKTMFSKLDSI